jgi:hypothetical protein
MLNIFKRVNKLFSNRNNSSQLPPPPELGGSRTSVSKNQVGGGVFGSLPRKTLRDLGLDDRKLKTYSVFELIDVLTDAHPDLSYALWNFIRLGNSGYSYTVKKIGSGKEYPQGVKEIDDLFQRLRIPNMVGFEKSKNIDKIIDQFFISAITRGAIACELVLTPDKNDVAFIAPVDPATIEFKIEGGRYIPYQDQGKIKLDIPTFIYEGIDERIDDPYGRSPFTSVLTIILFQLQVLNDIKAVVHNQGYPRLDIKVIEEVLLKRMPMAVRNNEVKKEQWLRDRLKEIIAMYNSLNPDDVFVHYDSVEIGEAGGKGGALIDPEKLMHAIDNLIQSGLKTLSTILGRRSTGNTESFAKIEIKLYLSGLAGIQKYIATVMEKILTLYLNIKGKQGIVEFRFKPIEIRSQLEQEQFRATQLNNIAFMYDRGWISQEEAARMAIGHDPVSPVPLVQGSRIRNADGGTVGPTVDNNPSAGGNIDNSNSN